MSTVERYLQLCAKVDAFFAGVQERYPDAMQCASGCSQCCRSRFSITGVEAAVITRFLEAATSELRARLAARSTGGAQTACAALADDGTCEIYEARPLVCRSHGVPIRSKSDSTSLPVIDACSKNFTTQPTLDDVAADAVLDQQTLSTVLMALDLAYAEEVGGERGVRFDLAELLWRCSA